MILKKCKRKKTFFWPECLDCVNHWEKIIFFKSKSSVLEVYPLHLAFLCNTIKWHWRNFQLYAAWSAYLTSLHTFVLFLLGFVADCTFYSVKVFHPVANLELWNIVLKVACFIVQPLVILSLICMVLKIITDVLQKDTSKWVLLLTFSSKVTFKVYITLQKYLVVLVFSVHDKPKTFWRLALHRNFLKGFTIFEQLILLQKL